MSSAGQHPLVSVTAFIENLLWARHHQMVTEVTKSLSSPGTLCVVGRLACKQLAEIQVSM